MVLRTLTSTLKYRELRDKTMLHLHKILMLVVFSTVFSRCFNNFDIICKYCSSY